MASINNKKYGIQNLDFLGSKFKIGYSTLTGKFQTKLGGYLTILMGLLSTSMFFIVMSQFFSKDAPVVTTSIESGSRENSFNLYEGNLWSPLGFAVGPKVIPANQISRYLTLKALVYKSEFKVTPDYKGYQMTPLVSFDFKPCDEIDDPHIQAYIDSFVELPGFRKLMSCPDFRGLHKKFVASVEYITLINTCSYVKIYPCSLPDPSQCASLAEISNLNIEYGYPSKLLKPADYENPVESLPVRILVRIDPRTTKATRELIRRNKVYDDTMSLVPPKLREEYTTLVHRSIDFGMRDPSQLHCSKEDVDKGIFGGCKEYFSFRYSPDSEVVITTRSYKKLTTMLGEFGGILKIITTAAFFVYGVYSMRKVKTVLGGIIFGAEEGKEKLLRELIDGKKSSSQSLTKVEKIREKGVRAVSTTETQAEDFQKLMERFVKRRSNVDNLMKKLNFLELIENVVLEEDEKTLIPLVLLEAEKSKLNNRLKDQKTGEEGMPGTKILGKEPNLRKSEKNAVYPKIQKGETNEQPNQENRGEYSYQKVFDSLLNKNPGSPFCQMIKEYMVSQLESTFSKTSYQSLSTQKEEKEGMKSSNPPTSFKQNRPQRIELFEDEGSGKSIEEIKTPQKTLIRKQSMRTGYMRPTNSPLRLKTRKKRPESSVLMSSASQTSLNRKMTLDKQEAKK